MSLQDIINSLTNARNLLENSQVEITFYHKALELVTKDYAELIKCDWNELANKYLNQAKEEIINESKLSK